MKTKRILALTLALMLTALLSSTALAVTYPSTGNNTSPEAAIEIQRNAVTPESKVNANTSKEHFATGNIAPNQEYWYKVYLLPNFDSVLSVNADCVRVAVYDPNMTRIFDELVMKDYDEGLCAYDIPVEEAGMYYIKVYGSLISYSYRISMGNPNYNLDNVTVDGERLTLSSGISTDDGDVNFAGVDIPENAFVYQVIVNGTRSARPQYETRSVSYGTGFRQTNSSFLLTYSPLVDIDNTWTIRWGGTARTAMTFDPEVTFYYAYQIPLTQWD